MSIKKQLYRFICLLTVVVLLAGCTPAPEPQPTAEPDPTSASATPDKETSSDGTVTLPLTKDPVTMSMYLVTRPGGTVPADSPAWAQWEEATNVHWDLTVVDGAAAAEQMKILFASEALPDVFFDNITTTQIMSYNRNGYFIDMLPLINEHAPNLKKLMENNDEVRSVMTLPNGQVSTMVWTNMGFEKGTKTAPLFLPHINQTWLDALNLSMPQTIEEFNAAMIAFRDKDPNGNKKADEIAIMGWNNIGDILAAAGAFHGFAMDTNTKTFLNGDTIEYIPTTDKFRDALKMVTNWYAEKLIDQDIFTLDNSQIIAKNSGDKPVYGALLNSGLFASDAYKYYKLLPIFQVYDNAAPVVPGRQYANPGSFCITKECKTPELAVKWADIFYSAEYANTYWMGNEGEHHEWLADGTWRWITKEGQTPSSLRQTELMWSLGLGPSLCTDDWFKVSADADPAEAAGNTERLYVANNYDCRLAIPPMYYEDSVTREISILSTDLNAYYDEMIAKFVTGMVKVDAEWDNFVATFERMGAKDLTALLQQTYDNR